jgi:hypothetical protein
MPEPLDYRPPEAPERRPIGAQGTAAFILAAGIMLVTVFGYVNKPVVNRSGRAARRVSTPAAATRPVRNPR